MFFLVLQYTTYNVVKEITPKCNSVSGFLCLLTIMPNKYFQHIVHQNERIKLKSIKQISSLTLLALAPVK